MTFEDIPVNGTDVKTPFQQTMDQVFLLTMAMLIQLMQCGFAFLEVGCVRSKNVSNILMKTLLDSFVAGIAYWTLGFAFAYGEGNSFIGWHNFASSGLPDRKFAYFFYEFVIASTASTIVSGAVAERCEMVAYLIYSFCLTGFIYPLVSRWAWSPEGWLFKGIEFVENNSTETISYHDFAGSGVVHMVGGTASFFAALILGPRIGRFHRESNTAIPIRGHSVPFAALGILILLIGFLAFNGGSQMSVSNPGDGDVISLAIVNTVISASMSAYVSLILRKFGIFGRTWNVLFTVNGSLAGMVASCSCCDALRPWGAAIVGCIAAVSFNTTSWIMCKLKIDDPVDAVAVHFGGGIWGVLSTAFLKYDSGILMKWNRKSGYILAWQLVGICAILAWAGCLSALLFGTLKRLGIFRVTEEMEKKGLDIPKHGGPAYPLDAYGHGYMEKLLTILEDGQLSSRELGYVNGHIHNGTDEGLYETPEVKVMNTLQAKFIPETTNGPVEGLTFRNGHISVNKAEDIERTVL